MNTGLLVTVCVNISPCVTVCVNISPLVTVCVKTGPLVTILPDVLRYWVGVKAGGSGVSIQRKGEIAGLITMQLSFQSGSRKNCPSRSVLEVEFPRCWDA